jgi:hypothetical protein
MSELMLAEILDKTLEAFSVNRTTSCHEEIGDLKGGCSFSNKRCKMYRESSKV